MRTNVRPGGGGLLNKKGIIPAFAVILTILTILISIGYAALNTNLNVSGEAFIRAKDNVRISRVDLSDAANDGYETYNPEYSKRTTKIYTTLPKDNSSVTYTVKVTNSTGVKYKVDSIEVDNTNPNVSCTPNIEVDSILEDGITEFTITANYKNGMSQDTNLDACEIKYEFSPLDKTPPVLSIQLVKDNGNTKTIKIIATDEADGSGLSPDNVYKYYLSTSSTEPAGGQWKEYTNDVGFEISGDLEVKYLWIYPVKDRAGNINDGKADINTAYVAKTYMFIDNSPTLYNVIAKEALTDGVAKLYTGKHNDAYDESGTKKIFHFYGADDSKGTEVLTKNNVIFGGFCWQMIRTTDTGGTKLIYNGVPKDENGKKVCTNSGTDTAIGTSGFSSEIDSLAHVGYMYNTVYHIKSKVMTSTDVYKYAKSFTYSNGTYKLSSDAISIDVTNSTEQSNLNNAHYTCFNTTGECDTIYNINRLYSNNRVYYIELQDSKSVEDALNEMLFADNVNKTNSAIKNVIDTWYANNMTSYTKYLESVVFCNDRSIIDYGGWDSNGGSVTSEGLAFKSNDDVTDLYCANITDSFSTDNSKAKLTYPVGLVSIADVELLGNDNARKSGVNQWLMSPTSLLYTDTFPYSRVRVLGDAGDNIWAATTSRVFYVRPSVSAAQGTRYVSGTGSTTDPYIVDLNAPTVTQETIIDGEREKTVRITVSDDYGLSSENKYKYYLSTSETELVGGEWKDYTNGEIFTITGENETKYLWIYPVVDNAGNINNGKADVNTPYLLMTVTFKNKNTLYNVLRKEYASGSGLSRLYSGKHNDSYNETGEENIYHFYGSDDEAGTNVLSKNNVLFGGLCWKMIRTTDTGGTKLIYNGVPKDENGKKVCTNSGADTAIGSSGFSSESDSLAHIGYMYNTVYHIKSKVMTSTDVYKYAKSFTYSNGTYKLSSDAISIDVTNSTEQANLNNAHYTCFNTTGECETIYNINRLYSNNRVYYIELQDGKSVEDALNEMLFADNVNQTNSAIKNVIDTWYANNMTRYTKYLESVVFCNDRSIVNYGGWDSNGGSVTSEGFIFKNTDNVTDLYCANITDRFSTDNSKAKLTYPIGLASQTDIELLGNNNARKSGVNQWLMSPDSLLYNDTIPYSRVRVLGSAGDNIYAATTSRVFYVRPSVSIASNIEYVSGTGSTTDPYVIGLTLSATTLTESGSKKTVKITVNGSSNLSSENKYKYYLSTSSTTLTGGEWKDYTLGEEFTLTGTNGTRYLWIYPIKDSAGNISDGRDNTSEPYYISSYNFVSTYTVTYVGNKFSTVPKVDNGITVTYDPDTSILTLNGTQGSKQNLNFMIASQSFSEGEEYKITLDYVSGSLTNVSSCAFATEASTSNGAAVSTRNYADTSLPTSGSSSSILKITSVGASEGTHLFSWIYIGTDSGGTTFTNYKIKVNITKVDTKKVNYNEPYGTLGDTPTRYGNTFAGWYTEEFSGTEVTSETIMSKESDHNVYAHWTLNNYTLTINPNGGTYNSSTSNTTMTVQYGKTQTIANPTRTGYVFNGWTVSGENSSMNGTTFTMGGANATLTAKWTAASYTLTINPNGGTYNGSTSNTTMTIQYGKTQTIANPTRTGYVFNGWTVTGTGSKISGTTFTMGSANATLKANWASAKPTYTYTGSSTLIDDGSGNWRIKFLTSGTLTFTNLGTASSGIDVFLVGGGGGAGPHGGGGGGGYTATYKSITVATSQSYAIVVGAGGAGVKGDNVPGDGGTSSAFSKSAAGGKAGGRLVSSAYGGAGGSGGGASCAKLGLADTSGVVGGSNGSDGGSTSHWSGGKGQGTTTREFGESSGTLYSGGGGGYCGTGGSGGGGSAATVMNTNGVSGTTNTGGGGGAGKGSNISGGSGGSGIVVIRNHR